MTVKTNWSLTEHLLSTYQSEYQSATQHPFLLAAAEGRLSKQVLGKWLANDRLYIHSYIKAAGKLLSSVDLPQTVPRDGEAAETQLVDWLIEALGGVRREERFFLDVAERYGLDVDLQTTEIPISQPNVGIKASVTVDESAKLTGLVMIQEIFSDIVQSPLTQQFGTTSLSEAPPSSTALPWLEGAVTFWGTERCYLDAWSWAKARESLNRRSSDATEDADGGALRKEFIPNWSSVDFSRFVGQLGSLIDFAVSQLLDRVGEEGAEKVKEEILGRVESKWVSLLASEAAFWPQVD